MGHATDWPWNVSGLLARKRKHSIKNRLIYLLLHACPVQRKAREKLSRRRCEVGPPFHPCITTLLLVFGGPSNLVRQILRNNDRASKKSFYCDNEGGPGSNAPVGRVFRGPGRRRITTSKREQKRAATTQTLNKGHAYAAPSRKTAAAFEHTRLHLLLVVLGSLARPLVDLQSQSCF